MGVPELAPLVSPPTLPQERVPSAGGQRGGSVGDTPRVLHSSQWERGLGCRWGQGGGGGLAGGVG